VIERVVNRIRRQLRHLQRQQHAGRIDRIEKTIRVADDDEAITGIVLRAIRVI
jgi:hypothetical protein